MAQGLQPSDNPEIVREFETRLLLVVFPVLCLFFVFFCIIYIYFFYLGVGAAVLRCHFSVHLIFLTTRPWRLCPLLVCLFIQQCLDGHVGSF